MARIYIPDPISIKKIKKYFGPCGMNGLAHNPVEDVGEHSPFQAAAGDSFARLLRLLVISDLTISPCFPW